VCVVFAKKHQNIKNIASENVTIAKFNQIEKFDGISVPSEKYKAYERYYV